MKIAAPEVGSGRRVGSNFLKLLRGRGLSMVLTLVSTAMVARALSPADFGIVVMIHTYLLVMQGLVKLNSFDAITQFGVPAQDSGEMGKLGQLLRMTLVLEVVGAVVGTALACGIVFLAGPSMGWSSTTTHLAMLYSLVLLSDFTGNASGVLRLFDRYDVLSNERALGPLVRVIIVVIAWSMGVRSIEIFLIAYGAGLLAQNLYLLQAAWREQRRHLPPGILKGEVWKNHRQRFPGFWQYLSVVYWQNNIDLIPKHASVLFAGLLLDSTMAGLLRLALQFSTVLEAPALLLRQVLLPDLSRLWHRKNSAFASVLNRSLLAGAGVGLLIALLSLLFAKPLLTLVVGEAYSDAAGVMYWLMLGAGLDMGTSALRAAGYAMGLAHSVLKVYIVALVAYVGLFFLLVSWIGLNGAGIATAITSILALLMMGLLVKQHLRHVARLEGASLPS